MKLIKGEHSAFITEAGGQRLGVDFGVFTSAEKMLALRPLHALCISHGHGDHFSQANIRAAGVPVAAPSDVVSVLPDGTVAHTLCIGTTMLIVGFAITPTPADHGPKVTKPIENLGLVIARAGCRVFYTGDMAVATPPPDGPFDLVLVPVDGGGFVFNAEQAVAFIRMLGHRGKVVPVHDADPAEPGCVERFALLAEGVCEAIVLNPGESVEVSS